MRFFMFLTRFSGKSQVAFLPLGLGSAFSVLGAGILSSQAIASPLTKSLSKKISSSDAFTSASSHSSLDSAKNALDASVETVLDLAFLSPPSASPSLVNINALLGVDAIHQPAFLAQPAQSKAWFEKTQAPSALTVESAASGSKGALALDRNAVDSGEDLGDGSFGENESDKRLSSEGVAALSQLLDTIDRSSADRSSNPSHSSQLRVSLGQSDPNQANPNQTDLDQTDSRAQDSLRQAATDLTATTDLATPSGPSIAPSFSETPLGELKHGSQPNSAALSSAESGSSLRSALPPVLSLQLPYDAQPSIQTAVNAIAAPLTDTKDTANTTATADADATEAIAAQPIIIQLPHQPILQRPNRQPETDADSFYQTPEQLNISSERLPELPERPAPSSIAEAREVDDELGTLRVRPQRMRTEDEELGDLLLNDDEDLGVLRALPRATVPQEPPKRPIAFLSGRLGFFDTDNAFRISQVVGENQTINSQIYQSGLSLLFFPKLSETTNLYAIAETNIARYGDEEIIITNLEENTIAAIRPNYNEAELQLGLRQKLFRRTYAQLGWRHQVLFEEGYRRKKLTANYIDARLSHRTILGSKSWLDSVYQARLGFTNSERADRFRQTFTVSVNHALTRDLRTSLLYQLDLADYTRTPRFDVYQQIFGTISYSLTPESRISLFAGTRFGHSSRSDIILDDTFYGASLNVTVPLF